MDYKVTEQLLHLIADTSRDENKNEVRNIGQAIVAPIWWRVAAMYWQTITLGHNTQHTCTGANQLEDTFLTFIKGPKTYTGTTIQDLHNECKYKLKLIGLIVCVVCILFINQIPRSTIGRMTSKQNYRTMNGGGDTVFEPPCSLWSLMKSLMDYQDQGQAAAAQGNYSHTIFTKWTKWPICMPSKLTTYYLWATGDNWQQ